MTVTGLLEVFYLTSVAFIGRKRGVGRKENKRFELPFGLQFSGVVGSACISPPGEVTRRPTRQAFCEVEAAGQTCWVAVAIHPSPSVLVPEFSSLSPEFVCSLDASDEFLKERVMNLPESVVAGTHYSQDRFLRALSNYRDINTDDETVFNYFDEIEIHPIHIGTK